MSLHSPKSKIWTILGVLEPGDGLGLGEEPGAVAVAGKLATREHLQRDDPAQPPVAGLVDDAHAAAAQLAEDLVLADPRRAASRHPAGRARWVAPRGSSANR